MTRSVPKTTETPMSEQGLLEMIRARVPRRQSGVTLGPGDDAALLSLAYAAAQGAGELVVTTDTSTNSEAASLCKAMSTMRDWA